MSDSRIQLGSPPDSRPTGLVTPAHQRAGAALAAVESGRITDAEKHIAAISGSDTIDRAWNSFLGGLVALERSDPAEAETLLRKAHALAFVAGMDGETVRDPDALRLAARALSCLGRLYRRQDRPVDARDAHITAHHLRGRHGSYEELWESAIELGLDADVARRYEDARRWYQEAIDAAGKASTDPHRRLAVAWTHLSTSYADNKRHDEAVEAARTARTCWREHDISDVTAAHADLKLGTILLGWGEVLHDCDDPRAKPVIEESVKWLAAARDALLAFGPDHASDAHLARQQRDFAERLLASVRE